MEEQGKLTECSAVLPANHRLCSVADGTQGVGIQKFCPGWLNDQRAEQAMLLVHIGKQVVMEKDGVQLLVGKEPLNQRLILSRPGNIVPAVGRAVGHDSIKFHQMDVIAYQDSCQNERKCFICFDNLLQQKHDCHCKHTRNKGKSLDVIRVHSATKKAFEEWYLRDCAVYEELNEHGQSRITQKEYMRYITAEIGSKITEGLRKKYIPGYGEEV